MSDSVSIYIRQTYIQSLETPQLLVAQQLTTLEYPTEAPYNTPAMNQKSITFRCSAPQLNLLTNAQNQQQCSRTELITEALAAFLEYAGQEHVRNKNLFDLVEDIDARCHERKFADYA